MPEATYLVVITAERYQERLEQLLSLPDAEFFATAVARYTGDVLLWEDHAEQRMILAIEAFYRNAESIATRARAVSCVLLSADECGDKFITEFVEPLYERPLFAEERERYLDFFRHAPHAGIDGQATAMTAALSSPHFLFRLETRDE